MFSSRGIQVALHTTAWLLFFGFIIASSAINRNNSFAEIFSTPFLLFYATYLSVFYLNELILLPWLYLRKKYGSYFLIISCLLIGVALLQPFDKIVKGQRESIESRYQRPLEHANPPSFGLPPEARPPFGWRQHPPNPHRIDIVSIVLFLAVWAVSMLLALFRQWRQTERRAAQAEIVALLSQRAQLKSSGCLA